jgi:hypothetical protein
MDKTNKTLLLEPRRSDTETEQEKQRSREPRQSKVKGHRVPRLCLLDGFSRELSSSRGVNLGRLEPLTELRVRTASAVYRITVLDPIRSRVLIQGGSLFTDAKQMTLSGASLGRSFLKMSSIWLGLQMELHVGDCTVVTSPVSSIEVLEDSSTGSFVA